MLYYTETTVRDVWKIQLHNKQYKLSSNKKLTNFCEVTPYKVLQVRDFYTHLTRVFCRFLL